MAHSIKDTALGPSDAPISFVRRPLDWRPGPSAGAPSIETEETGAVALSQVLMRSAYPRVDERETSAITDAVDWSVIRYPKSDFNLP
jgi:hypothetical protein